MTAVTVIQVAWILALPKIGGPSSSSPSRCRQTMNEYAMKTSTNAITGAARTARTWMSHC